MSEPLMKVYPVQTRAEKIARKRLDDQITRIAQPAMNGVQISILDIPKIYAAGRTAAAMGESIEIAVRAAIERHRQN